MTMNMESNSNLILTLSAFVFFFFFLTANAVKKKNSMTTYSMPFNTHQTQQTVSLICINAETLIATRYFLINSVKRGSGNMTVT